MLLGILSDTHMPKRAKELPIALIDGLKSVDLIIHAGDWQMLDVYKELVALAPVVGVAGNVDAVEVIEQFGYKKVLKIDDFKIGLVHGHGKGRTTEQRVLNEFKEQTLNCIIFGHSHIPVNKTINDILLFNPGSPTDKRRQKQYSYGLISVNGGELTAQHIFYSDKQ
ncbi:metallophosphoesterase [Cytobacillus sp. S13-E01]|uniref:metallophosphoesterase family protein n=1 Tax=Cytobacillus sp. S13-E01 TaxID=3031326 RepID=UPI0023D897DA|nr:metallophosphoesterase [Cytobacillus sp. S13-E01]MDF0725683.1 metallophosphoesterase [Cytobacillus sp. S13-E01]